MSGIFPGGKDLLKPISLLVVPERGQNNIRDGVTPFSQVVSVLLLGV